MSQWVKKLVTKEDPIHVHKTLGLAVLVSFGVRFAMFGDSDMGFLTHPEWTLATLALHLLLNISAFEFHLPKKRIAAGDRIWNEYRAVSRQYRSLLSLVRQTVTLKGSAPNLKNTHCSHLKVPLFAFELNYSIRLSLPPERQPAFLLHGWNKNTISNPTICTTTPL